MNYHFCFLALLFCLLLSISSTAAPIIKLANDSVNTPPLELTFTESMSVGSRIHITTDRKEKFKGKYHHSSKDSIYIENKRGIVAVGIASAIKVKKIHKPFWRVCSLILKSIGLGLLGLSATYIVFFAIYALFVPAVYTGWLASALVLGIEGMAFFSLGNDAKGKTMKMKKRWKIKS